MRRIMKFKTYLNELKSDYSSGITFVDVDETIYKTFAKIYVIKDNKIIKKLNNKEFNTYKLKDGESFDFREFRDAKMFRKTSIPINKTINRIKRMLKNIDIRKSRIVFLTARADFDDKKEFLQTFRDYGINIDNIYVERAGNEKGIVSQIKKKIVTRYLNTGEYRRVRMLDDDITNIKEFLKIEKELPESLINKIKKKHNIKEKENIPVIEFFGLLVGENGSLTRIQK